MRNEGIDIGALETVAGEQLFANFGLFTDGELEYLLAILVNIVHFLVDSFVTRGIQASPSRHVQGASSGSVNLVDKIDQADRIIFRGFEDRGPRTVAEDHAGGAIGVIND